MTMFENLDKNRVKVQFRAEKWMVYFHTP
jgi:hypothetical protein